LFLVFKRLIFYGASKDLKYLVIFAILVPINSKQLGVQLSTEISNRFCDMTLYYLLLQALQVI